MPKESKFPQPNGYDYNERDSPILQFRAALDMEHSSQNFRFLDIKAALKKLSLKYLVAKEMGCAQTVALDTIERKLLSLYPKIYAGAERDKRLYFSRRLSMYFHTQRRSAIKKNAKIVASVVSPQRNATMRISTSPLLPHNLHVNGTTDLTPINLNPDIPFSQQQQPLSEDESGSKFQSSNIKYEAISSTSTQSRYLLRGLRDDPQPTLVSLSPVFQKLESDDEDMMNFRMLPEVKKESLPNIPVLLRSRGEEYAFIYDFLGGCQPSMKQLISRFLENGCDSEAKLRALARWSSIDRKNWLRDICEREVFGRAIKEMDIGILDNYIESFCA